MSTSIDNVTTEGGHIKYTGTREALLEAGVASPDMFPANGRQRKFLRWTTGEYHRRSWFCCTRLPDGRYRVTRWLGWNDEAEAARVNAEHERVRQSFLARLRQCGVEEIELQHANKGQQLDLVTYVGAREQLIEAGVAVEGMFPEHGKRRRWSAGHPCFQAIVADRFAVTLRHDGLWLVTRERGWQDQGAIKARNAAREAERQRHAQDARQAPAAAAPGVHGRQGATAPGSASTDGWRERMDARWRATFTCSSAAEFRTKALEELAYFRERTRARLDGRSGYDGYRLASAGLAEVLEALDDAIAALAEARVERDLDFDAMPAPLANCLRAVLPARHGGAQ